MISINVQATRDLAPGQKNVGVLAQGFERNTRRVAEEILRVSKYYVPMDEGNLHDSGKVVHLGGTGFRARYAISYGSDEVDYAQFVALDKDKRHGEEYNEWYADRIARGLDHPRRAWETADFLENAVFEVMENVPSLIAEMVVS